MVVQTIYAWRLADVRRVLDLAGALPGLRRVDLVTNYRCPRPVVERAVRLISGNTERFAKSIRAREGAAGTLALAPDSGDDLDRARRLLATWLPAAPRVHAVLARTNIELAPYAALALERGILYRAAEDGLLLDDDGLDALLGSLPADVPPAVALARSGLGPTGWRAVSSAGRCLIARPANSGPRSWPHADSAPRCARTTPSSSWPPRTASRAWSSTTSP